VDFKAAMAGLEPGPPSMMCKCLIDPLIMDLSYISALFADLEGDDAAMNVPLFRMTANDKGVEALKPMNTADRYQLVERTVDLQRSIDTVVLQVLQDLVSG
jgi:hypothetical protein